MKYGRTARWKETFDSLACCSFQRYGFKIGENITTTLQDGTPITMRCIKKFDNTGDIQITINDGIEDMINKAVTRLLDENIKTLNNKLETKWNKTIEMKSSNLSSDITDMSNNIVQLLRDDIKTAQDKQNSDWTKSNAILANQVNQTEAEVTSLQTKVTEINQSLQHLPGKWSQGSYCILANGDCPAGFTKKSGVIRAIKNIAGDYRYIKEEQFGDSKISCHATCGDPNNWNADIYIVTCCK